MKVSKYKSRDIFYFDSKEHFAFYEFGNMLTNLLRNCAYQNRTLIFLCIGSDRATGDCLGPILGYKLSRSLLKNYVVYGTLDCPVHAKNLEETIEQINKTHKNPLIIAIDASLGTPAHIGFVTLGTGPLKPGAGVDKNLPYVGDIFVTGIVNLSGLFDQMLLQTTRLNVVMSLADHIYLGIRHCISLLSKEPYPKTLQGSAANSLRSN